MQQIFQDNPHVPAKLSTCLEWAWIDFRDNAQYHDLWSAYCEEEDLISSEENPSSLKSLVYTVPIRAPLQAIENGNIRYAFNHFYCTTANRNKLRKLKLPIAIRIGTPARTSSFQTQITDITKFIRRVENRYQLTL